MPEERNWVAIDPSFTKCGLAMVNHDKKTLLTDTVGVEKAGSVFRDTFFSAEEVSGKVIALLRSVGIESPSLVLSEIPPPVGSYSAGLYGLDILMLHRLGEVFPFIPEIYVFYPSYVKYLHGKQKVKQIEHKRLGIQLLSAWQLEYKIHTRKKEITADESVALFFLSRMMVCKYPSSSVSAALVEKIPRFQDEKEHVLNSLAFP
jgi:hypothetical protein